MFSKPKSFSEFLARSIHTFPYLAVTIGPLFLCIGLWMVYSSTTFLRTSIEVEALVVAVEERRGDNGIVFRPTFKAETPNGDSFVYAGNTWVAPKPHEVGETVTAHYDQATGVLRSDPLLKNFQSMGRRFMCIGGIFAVLGIGLFGRRLYLRQLKAGVGSIRH